MLLPVFADLKDSRNSCGVCQGEAARVLDCFLNDGSNEVFEAYTANGKSTNTLVYHGNLPVVIIVLIRRFSNKNVLQEADDLVNRGSKRPKMTNWNLRPDFVWLRNSVVTFLQLLGKFTTTFAA